MARHGRFGQRLKYEEVQARRDKMRELYLEGKTVEEIAEIVGRSVQTVKNSIRFLPQEGDE